MAIIIRDADGGSIIIELDKINILKGVNSGRIK